MVAQLIDGAGNLLGYVRVVLVVAIGLKNGWKDIEIDRFTDDPLSHLNRINSERFCSLYVNCVHTDGVYGFQVPSQN